MTDNTGTTVRAYDGLNRTTSKAVPEIGESLYQYDIVTENVGEYCETTTDPKGNVSIKTYDKVGRLSVATVGNESTTYEYQPNGVSSKVTYQNGTSEIYKYDKNNRVIRLDNKLADATVISYFSYTYDRAGNQLSKTEKKGTTTYTYDSLNRLSTVTEPEGKVTSYTYDGAGNRKTETVLYGQIGSSTINNYDNRNRLTSTISQGGAYTKFLYDNNGNLVSKTCGTMKISENDTSQSPDNLQQIGLIIKKGNEQGTGSSNINLYTYDKFNRLINTKSEKNSASYKYNAQGYRVEKKVNGEVTRYLYEGDKVVLEADDHNTQKAFQLYGNNLIYRVVNDIVETGSQSYYYLYNAHGDVTELITEQGNIEVSYDYDAFGNILSQNGNANNTIRYAGYQYDEESGLYYLNARYYDSVTARFLTEDTYRGQANDPLSLNLYTYCHNEPIMYTDPTGHSWKQVVNVAKKSVSVAKSFGKGVTNSVKDTFNTVAEVVTHPVKTFINYSLAKTPGSPTYQKNSTEIMAKKIIKVVNDKIINGTAEDRAYVLGYATGEFGQAVALDGIGTAVKTVKVAKIAKVAKVTKVTKVTKIAKVAKVTEISADASKAGKIIEEIVDLSKGAGKTEKIFKGGSNTTKLYHSAGDNVADIIVENGFRTDLPNPQAAFNNNRYGRGVYLADLPATALSERPGGIILEVDAYLGKSLDVTNRGILDYDMGHAIARGARKHGYDSIVFNSAQRSSGINTVILDPNNIKGVTK